MIRVSRGCWLLLDVTGCYRLLARRCAQVQVRDIPMRPQLWRDDATLHWISLDSVDIYLVFGARARTEMSLALESADYPSTKESKVK